MAAADPTSSGVTVTVTDETASATGVVDAPAPEVFDFLRRPSNHGQISGDGSVRDRVDGPEMLEMGSRFGVKMKMGVPYRMHSTVVEFEPDRRIAWAHFGKHRWRWELEPIGDDRTRVTETFDASTARSKFFLKLLGYPKRHGDNVRQSVENVIAHFAR